MRRFVINILCLILTFSMGTRLSAQKIKREYRISPTEVHPDAKAFVKETLTGSRVKWYAEEHEDGKTIEAKGENGNRAFSIEFDRDGKILDIEKEIRFPNLDAALQTRIRSALSKELLRYQMISTQEVRKGLVAELKKSILEPESNLHAEKTYELVVRGRNKSGMGFFEFLFDESGNLIEYVELKK